MQTTTVKTILRVEKTIRTVRKTGGRGLLLALSCTLDIGVVKVLLPNPRSRPKTDTMLMKDRVDRPRGNGSMRKSPSATMDIVVDQKKGIVVKSVICFHAVLSFVSSLCLRCSFKNTPFKSFSFS